LIHADFMGNIIYEYVITMIMDSELVFTATINERGQMTVPMTIRKVLDLKRGDVIEVKIVHKFSRSTLKK